jgi:HD-GYP domain-containing protein (c-di-GMP phosphodiesterase class II)
MTVAAMAEAVAHELNLPAEEIEQVIQAAELHNVGKVAIPESILNKPGPLTDDEWSFMKRHTLIGENILSAAPALAGRAPWSDPAMNGLMDAVIPTPWPVTIFRWEPDHLCL